MKRYKDCLLFSHLFLIMGLGNLSATEKKIQPYSFTVENKVLNKKIYVAIYEKFGPSRWKRFTSTSSIDPLKSYNVALSQEHVTKKNYLYAVATDSSVLSKNIISQQEADALDTHSIATPKITIDSTSFSSKNPLDLGTIAISNNYKNTLFIARYITNPLEKSLTVTLASPIFQCNSDALLSFAIPVGYIGTDVIILAAHKSDDLKTTIDLKNIPSNNIFIARTSFKDWKKDAPKNSYTATQLFAQDVLTITNDTAQDWIVCLYAYQSEQQLQRVSDPLRCPSKKDTLYNKKLMIPVTAYQHKPSVWVLFDHSDQKMSPLISINNTLLGGTIARSTKAIRLGSWFTENKKTIAPVISDISVDDMSAKEDISISTAPETAIDASISQEEPTISPAISEAQTQDTLLGTFDMQISNVTSKNVFVALYAKDKKSYTRREKPIEIAPDQSSPLGFEEHEALAYSVSACELTGVLTSREWTTLNTQENLKKLFDGKDFPIKETMFKNDSLRMVEVTIENKGYSDIVVARYEQKKPGKITIAGVVQKIAKKDSSQEAAHFALPHNYKGFVGYQTSYSEDSSATMDTSINTAFAFRRNHLSKVDITEKKSFDAQTDFTGNCLVVENDFTERKWVGLYTLQDVNLHPAESISAGSTKEFIPYYNMMKLIAKDGYFNVDLPLETIQPYAEHVIDASSTNRYYLKDAKIMATAQKKLSGEKPIIQKEPQERRKPTTRLAKKPAKPFIREKELPAETKHQLKPEFFVEIEEKKEEQTHMPISMPIKKKPAMSTMKDSECSDKQIRINNHSKKDVVIQFYYKGFFSTTMVEKRNALHILQGQELCIDRPASTYLSDRYVVAVFDVFDLKQHYSNKEIAQLVKENKAFNIEKKKIVTLSD